MRKKSFDAHLRSAASLILLASLLTACLPPDLAPPPVFGSAPTETPADASPSGPEVTAQPTRPPFPPGELVDYIAQAGDTLPVLAARFNTTLEEIRAANTFIPPDATTMPPGMPMKIPIYYLPLWGSAYQILPDAHFINGPAAVGFDPVNFVETSPGWLKTYSTYILDRDRSAGEVIQYVATNYSVSPRLLISLLEYQLGAVSQPDPAEVSEDIQIGYPLGIYSTSASGLYRQMAAVANELNNTYYLYRSGEVREFFLSDGQMVRPDPWQNAATVALQIYFAKHYSAAEYNVAVSADGFAAVFQRLFGDPWSAAPHIPGSLHQPEMRLPFPAGSAWTYTGGPHTPWGDGPPYGAIDFAPPTVVGGCISTDEFATAVASGVIARTGLGTAVLDLDGDGDERTGWVMFYLHLAAQDRLEVGQQVAAGDPIGHPSCEGGKSTGTHVHIARKYNGEWMLADGPLAFNLDGWISSYGGAPYLGYLKRNGRTVTACVCSDSNSQLQAEFH
jgi:LasA protease